MSDRHEDEAMDRLRSEIRSRHPDVTEETPSPRGTPPARPSRLSRRTLARRISVRKYGHPSLVNAMDVSMISIAQADVLVRLPQAKQAEVIARGSRAGRMRLRPRSGGCVPSARGSA